MVQVIYNVFDQAPEDELFPVCQEFNVGVIARVPLDEGSLGGKLTAETRFRRVTGGPNISVRKIWDKLCHGWKS